jgi:aryl-alcohol dehydrogenase-like predicted oxidoreductase
MLKRKIGRTELIVSPVGLGTNAVGGHNIYNYMTDDGGRRILRAAFDCGMDFIDTAYWYGLGRSEELISDVMGEYRNRNDIVIATKAAHRFEEGNVVMDNSVEFMVKSVYDSMARLGTDYIDLFYVHYPDKDTPKYEVIGALKDLKDKGVIKAIGVSNFSMEQLEEANIDGYVDVIQDHYNLLKRDAEKDLIPYCREKGISFVPYYPLASGFLTGKFNRYSTFMDSRTNNPLFKGKAFIENLEKVEKLKVMAKQLDVAPQNLALAWYLSQDVIDAVIPGAKNVKQVMSNCDAMTLRLSDSEIAAIDEMFR